MLSFLFQEWKDKAKDGGITATQDEENRNKRKREEVAGEDMNETESIDKDFEKVTAEKITDKEPDTKKQKGILSQNTSSKLANFAFMS